MEKKNYNPEKALSQAREAYKSETPEIKKLLEDIFGKDNLVNPLEVCDRVTSFETACAEIGVDAAAFMEKYKDEPKDVIAYHKLRIIAEALNEGWKPQFKKGEYRWFPWFYLYTKGEIENMTEEEKKQRNLLLLWGGVAYDGTYAGLGYAHSDSAFSNAYSNVGARLAVKTEALAIYFGRQFIEIWADFVAIKW